VRAAKVLGAEALGKEGPSEVLLDGRRELLLQPLERKADAEHAPLEHRVKDHERRGGGHEEERKPRTNSKQYDADREASQDALQLSEQGAREQRPEARNVDNESRQELPRVILCEEGKGHALDVIVDVQLDVDPDRAGYPRGEAHLGDHQKPSGDVERCHHGDERDEHPDVPLRQRAIQDRADQERNGQSHDGRENRDRDAPERALPVRLVVRRQPADHC